MKKANRRSAETRMKGRGSRPRKADFSLRKYQAKRDFSQSPEPRGRRAGKRAQRFFCIQKHLASHLHYDLRLEHHGVLLSWAVPKGPSPDPAIKRLAMQVESHPLDYGTFEGVIPSGYGAGIVVLWDRGEWEPLISDVDAALKKGHLPFVMMGEKVKGAWHLIKADRAGAKAWLLIKQADAWASDVDPTMTSPGSVATQGDFAEVLARQAANPWPDHAPVRGGETGKLFNAVIARAAALERRGTRR